MKVEVASWAPVPNKPTVSVDVKQRSTNVVSEEMVLGVGGGGNRDPR